MSEPTTLNLWRDALTAVRPHVGRLLVVGVIARLFVASILGPLSALALHLGMRLSNEPVVTDLEMIRIATSPVSLVGAAGCLLIVLVGWGVELVAMASLLGGRADATWPAIRLAAASLPAAAPIVPRLVWAVARVVVPIVLALLAAYLLLLSRYDINYYLEQKPTEFWLAIGVAVASLGYQARALVRLFSRWIEAPALIAEGLGTEGCGSATAAEQSLDQRLRRRTLWQWIAVSAAAPIVLGSVGSLLLLLITPWWPRSIVGVATGVGIVLCVSWLGGQFCSWISTVLLAALSHAFASGNGEPVAVKPAPRWLDWATPARVVAVAVCLVGVSALVGLTALERLQPGERVAVIAHRGASLVAPENSLSAIEAAIAAGADWVEIDVQETQDGEVVVFHDRDFMKAAGEPLRVADATANEIAQIDIGSRLGAEFTGERAPLLRDVLEACRDRVGLLIELKYYGQEKALEQRVVATVEAAGVQEQVRFMSLKRAGVAKLKQLRPEWTVGLLLSVYAGAVERLETDFFAMNAASINHRFVASASAAGKDVYAWTVNEPKQMATLAAVGVDGLITDDPALAKATLAEWRDASPVTRLLVYAADRFGWDLASWRQPGIDATGEQASVATP